jgi:hypothetical protein
VPYATLRRNQERFLDNINHDQYACPYPSVVDPVTMAFLAGKESARSKQVCVARAI